MDLKNVDLLAMQTGFMQQDPTTRGMCAALTPQFQQIANETKKCLILANIDEQSEEVLDALAVDLHIDWYDPTASIEIKRALVKSSDKVHMYLGTPYAAEQLMEDYFGDGVEEEWYEYGGTPGHYRVITTNPTVTGELATQFMNTLAKVGRKSARLDQIIISMSAELPEYYGFALQTGDFITIEQVV